MKFNKWTVGLAAAGLVTLPSLTRAVDANMVQTMAAGTTLSGYVDVAAQWNLGTGNANNPAYGFNATGAGSKADGFNLNVVDLVLDKPLDETPWAAGYTVNLAFGPDAGTLGTDSTFANAGDFAVRQAYVTLRTPIGNGIDWKIGVFNTIIGYESASAAYDPNYTRSYGWTAEPTTHEGILGTYKICDAATVSVGVANTFGPQTGTRHPTKEDTKVWMAALTLTAPKSWGWLADSSWTAVVINGFSAAVPNGGGALGNGNLTHYYTGLTLATPVTGLKAGVAVDYRHIHDTAVPDDTWIYGVYASYQATEKLSLHMRGEYVDDKAGLFTALGQERLFEVTATVQYDLWKNVISRAEVRWDHASNGQFFGGSVAGTPTRRNAVMLAANVIYKF